jgi:hypothetical protein
MLVRSTMRPTLWFLSIVAVVVTGSCGLDRVYVEGRRPTVDVIPDSPEISGYIGAEGKKLARLLAAPNYSPYTDSPDSGEPELFRLFLNSHGVLALANHTEVRGIKGSKCLCGGRLRFTPSYQLVEVVSGPHRGRRVWVCDMDLMGFNL